MKRFTLVAAAILLSLTACGGSREDPYYDQETSSILFKEVEHKDGTVYRCVAWTPGRPGGWWCERLPRKELP